MYRWQILALLLLSIGGVISVTLDSLFQVFSVPLEEVDVGGYCDRLESQLVTTDSSIILLQIGASSRPYEVILGERNATKTSRREFANHSDEIGDDSQAKDLIVQQIRDSVIAVKRHPIVEYITFLALDGEYLLTVERIGDLEEPTFTIASGDEYNVKLLLSLVGGSSGGRIKNLERIKKS